MQTTLKIDNGTVQVTSGGAYGPAVPEAAFAQRLHAMIARPMGLLPPVVRYISPLRRWVMLERSPHLATLIYRSAKAKDAETNRAKEWIFQLPLPWTVELINLDQDFYPSSIAIYALRHAISTETDTLGMLPLPNFYVSSAVCLPPRTDFDPLPNVGTGVLAAHRLAWEGGFNTDTLTALKHCARYRRPSPLFDGIETDIGPAKVYALWEERATLDTVGDWDWLEPRGFGTHAEPNDPALPTIGELIAHIHQEESRFFDIDTVQFFLNSTLTSLYD